MKFITRRMKLKDAFSDKRLKEIADDLDVKEDVEFIRKGIAQESVETGKPDRSMIGFVSTLSVDRDGEVVLPEGIDTTEYKKNPVVMWGHGYSNLPIGRNLWLDVKDPKGVKALTQYASHQKAEDVYNYEKDGFPLASSIGFIPIESVSTKDKGWEETYKQWKDRYSKAFGDGANDKVPNRIYTKVSLLEYSKVPIPSNPDAVNLAIQKGLLTEEEAQEYIVIDDNEPETNIKADDDETIYNCECIDCGWTTKTKEHCKDITCDKCGGEMRRAERPGEGRSVEYVQLGETIFKVDWDGWEGLSDDEKDKVFEFVKELKADISDEPEIDDKTDKEISLTERILQTLEEIKSGMEAKQEILTEKERKELTSDVITTHGGDNDSDFIELSDEKEHKLESDKIEIDEKELVSAIAEQTKTIFGKKFNEIVISRLKRATGQV